jgi:dihydroorotase
MKILIKNGRVVDPANNLDGVRDILIEGSKISAVSKKIGEKIKTIDARGRLVLPGLIDMHVHLREPGREDAETIETGTAAAVHGGFTGVACMPNTTPPIDNAGVVEFILSQAEERGYIRVYPVGAITRGLAGEELSDIGELFSAGIAAISDDGEPVKDGDLMRRALEYAKMFNLTVISHCEDKSLSSEGVMNEGFISTVLGLPGIPQVAEEAVVARDIMLAQLTQSKLHIAHVSTAGSVELIRRAKEKGISVSAETAPHYFTLTDEEVRSFSTNTRVNPPLRTSPDVEAIKQGLKDGTIDVIATDHAPHSIVEKEMEFSLAPPGIIGLETSFSLVMSELVEGGVLTLGEAIAKMTVNPSSILGLGKGTLSPGADADITIVEPDAEYTVDAEKFYSKSKNSPFIGRKLKGIVETVIVGGKPVLENGKLK